MAWSGHKYSSAVAEVLYSVTISGLIDSSGHSDAPTGWFTQPIEITVADVYPMDHQSDIRTALTELCRDHNIRRMSEEASILRIDLLGTHIVRSDDQGFVWVESFGKDNDRQSAASDAAAARFEELEADFLVWLTACVDCGSPTDEDGDCTVDDTHNGADENR